MGRSAALLVLLLLRAAPGLHRDDAFYLDGVAAPTTAHVVGERQQRRQLFVGNAQAGKDARLVEADPVLEDVGPRNLEHIPQN